MSNQVTYKVEEVGTYRLSLNKQIELEAGEVGYLIAGIKTINHTRVGDTVTNHDGTAITARRNGVCTDNGDNRDVADAEEAIRNEEEEGSSSSTRQCCCCLSPQ